MNHPTPKIWLIAGGLLVAGLGCGEPPATAPPVAMRKPTPPEATLVSQEKAEPPATVDAQKPTAGWQNPGDPTTRPIEPPSEAKLESPEPPFPPRENPFAPPRSADLPHRPRTQLPGDQSLQLIGFVRVAQLGVVLLVDGELATLRAGESQGSLEVIEIDPPSVTLRRGGRVWTERLERHAAAPPTPL